MSKLTKIVNISRNKVSRNYTNSIRRKKTNSYQINSKITCMEFNKKKKLFLTFTLKRNEGVPLIEQATGASATNPSSNTQYYFQKRVWRL